MPKLPGYLLAITLSTFCHVAMIFCLVQQPNQKNHREQAIIRAYMPSPLARKQPATAFSHKSPLPLRGRGTKGEGGVSAKTSGSLAERATLTLNPSRHASPIGNPKAPAYPALARDMQIEGIVLLKVAVSKNGQVKRAVVEKGLGYGCDEAALAYVQKIQFAPAINDQGEFAEDTVPYALKFVLDG